MSKQNKIWVKIPVEPGVNSLPNLYVLTVGGVERGIVQKPKDTKSSKSPWGCFVGFGETCKFFGHGDSLKWAKAKVEQKIGL